MILNFDQHGKYIHIANSGLEKDIVHAEEDFSRIIRDVESLVGDPRKSLYCVPLTVSGTSNLP